jgi:hypothetical protein
MFIRIKHAKNTMGTFSKDPLEKFKFGGIG